MTRTHRVFEGTHARGTTISSTTHSAPGSPRRGAQTTNNDASNPVELISIQPLDYEQWLAAWSGNEGEDPLEALRSPATAAELRLVTRAVCKGGSDATGCAICLTRLECGETESRLPCGHGFHEACVARWFTRSKCCPQCRRSLAEGLERGESGGRDEEEALGGEARREIPEENAPMPSSVRWTDDSSGVHATEATETERRERYANLMPTLHELRRDFELILRNEVVFAEDAQAGAARVRETLRGIHSSSSRRDGEKEEEEEEETAGTE